MPVPPELAGETWHRRLQLSASYLCF
jgi:hypothetical protein